VSVVLITGGTGAIGSAAAEEFSKTDDVIITYLSKKAAAEEMKSRLGCGIVCMDVTDADSVNEAVESVIKEYGHIDVLVNNAGISLIKPFLDITPEEWERVISVDLCGCFYTAKAAAAGMVSRKSGSIVNVSSVWGVHGASCETAYSAAKAGLIGFTKALAKELGPSGITVNAVAPGVIDSPMNSEHLTPDELRELEYETPLQRLGRPDEVARAIRAVSENRFITGQVLGVDGGFY